MLLVGQLFDDDRIRSRTIVQENRNTDHFRSVVQTTQTSLIAPDSELMMIRGVGESGAGTERDGRRLQRIETLEEAASRSTQEFSNG
jgi:hypothetical protein